ncbi:Cof-type HAD-IIB family hydrolase [Ornithinibacillus halophilus]|uniref:Cof subfamily of IIB subfamily of haloacid dehalogenase superfamily/HAD-superfamily hydrolase, subfamily IIB n=1 Tax=Ornithinibacillus halophilus TaxID=930117 RepID=A0A1M5JRF7_9BACI|nr:Cof-type HAD-IIB family hydrolase [Ornithinibacillus halophilus]SHG43134.1 hypothetical protein SAMN05216225_10331 [Ornithinibacillus halophilus]
MTYNILFLDIDGTILKPDHTYTALTKEAITKAIEKGLEVFLATGRPIHEIDDLAEDLGIQSLIGYNGAYATYQDRTIINEPMDSSIVKKFINIASEKNHELVMYTNERNYFTTLNTPEIDRFIKIFNLHKNNRVNEDILENILGMTIINMDPEDTTLYEFDDDILLSQVNIDGVRRCYDVIRTTVNKGQAIKRVLRELQIHKENSIAFGDGMNDKEMLQAVGEGVAMGNANPDLLNYAKHQTTTVEKSGIYYGLKKLNIIS